MQTRSDSADKIEVINISEILLLIWEKRVLAASIIAIFFIASLIYAFTQPTIYRAQALVMPITEEQASSFMPGQLGLVANLTGLNVNQENPKSQKALAIMKSREFIQNFVEKHDLSLMLIASNWDEEQGRNVIDPSLYDVESSSWVSGNEPKNSISWEVYRVFSEMLVVNEDVNSQTITVSLDWTDPAQAANWVNLLISDVNDTIKQADLKEANDAIEYLTSQISTTQLVEMQRAFYELVESQLRVVMLADVRDQYVLEVVDRAVIPEEKTSPRIGLIAALGLLAGVVVALILILLIPQNRPSG